MLLFVEKQFFLVGVFSFLFKSVLVNDISWGKRDQENFLTVYTTLSKVSTYLLSLLNDQVVFLESYIGLLYSVLKHSKTLFGCMIEKLNGV